MNFIPDWESEVVYISLVCRQIRQKIDVIAQK